MKKKILLIITILVQFLMLSQAIKKEISGKVTSAGNLLKKVNVRINSASTGMSTNALGRYSIQAMVNGADIQLCRCTTSRYRFLAS